MTSLPDAERDAAEAQRALDILASLLARLPLGADGAADPGAAGTRRELQRLAEDGAVAAERIVAFLNSLRGAGDGAAVAVPSRLGPWRDWVPPRGHLFGGMGGVHRIGEVPQPRRCDPGE